jgi:hypothetical protein
MKWTFRFAGVLQGLGMLVEARGLLWPTGSEEPQPWMHIVAVAGIDPAKMGPILAVFGLIWIAVTILVVLGHRRMRVVAAAIAFATLWYFWFGTVLAVLYLFALATLRERTEA